MVSGLGGEVAGEAEFLRMPFFFLLLDLEWVCWIDERGRFFGSFSGRWLTWARRILLIALSETCQLE